MIAEAKSMQPCYHRRAGELKMQVENAVKTARRADSLSDVVQAVGEYAAASEKSLQLARLSEIQGLLKNCQEAVAEVYATEAAKEKLEPASAQVAKNQEVERAKAPVQAAVTTASNHEEDFARLTTARKEREKQAKKRRMRKVRRKMIKQDVKHPQTMKEKNEARV